MSVVNTSIIRGERLAQKLRPASLTYWGDTIPCVPGNVVFFEQLISPVGGGFQKTENLHVKILRRDITKNMLAANPSPFFSGHEVIVTNLDKESPGFGEQFTLVCGEGNVIQSQVIQLQLHRILA